MEQIMIEECFLKLWEEAERNGKADDDKTIKQMKRMVEYYRLLGKLGKKGEE